VQHPSSWPQVILKTASSSLNAKDRNVHMDCKSSLNHWTEIIRTQITVNVHKCVMLTNMVDREADDVISQ